MKTLKNGFRGVVAALMFAVVAVAATSASAQQKPSAAALATAKEILKLKGASNMYTGAVVAVTQSARTSLYQANLNLGKELDEVAKLTAAKFAAREQEPAEEIAQIYASEFSEQELKDILAFYSSPLGKKMTAQEPKAMQSSIVAINKWTETLTRDVLENFRVEMRKRGKDL